MATLQHLQAPAKLLQHLNTTYRNIVGPAAFTSSGQTTATFERNRVRTGHGKPGKSWNLVILFSRPGKSWNLGLGHGKSWKISTLSMSERQ